MEAARSSITNHDPNLDQKLTRISQKRQNLNLKSKMKPIGLLKEINVILLVDKLLINKTV